MDKVVLAFSGGLDTSVCIKLLEEKYNMEVITACVDVGQPREEIERPAKIAEELGNYKHYTIDAKEEFAKDYIFKAIKANASYEGYPLSTALARPLIATKIVEIAKKEGASAIAHGCTGKGNDQFRFEAIIRSMSDCKVIAPIRDLNLTRSEETEYANSCGIPLPPKKQYSIDENLWGRAIEGDILEDPMVEPPEDAFTWTKSPDKTPKNPETVQIGFKEGIPHMINGEEMEPVELIRKANSISGEHGIGRVDIIEDRIIGMKSREVYETPAAFLLIEAHRALEQLTLTRNELKFADIMSGVYSELVYYGLWHEPLREDLDKAIDHMQRRVTGTVNVKLHKGNMRITGRESPYSLYSEEIVSFEDKSFDQREMKGMVKNYGLQARLYQKMWRE
ncbi:MAG TPA: argininosuccinate synthase [Methanothermobacter sp.]|mgnify:CR=1 FL=1|nr:argininosuccinate synthase [Methanothermobacter sp. MT-2]HHW04852.1 argininosuccinate synthase [Methanothermobacter sp.]HOK72152.1 argininosuccinate synthase [Methanothermobacter sp.]HOL68465.1 argininosuccinate synthase [Methanothermobacter sp.]HPQ04223.1 argininosuccinate synthase [Methanothermobacter sp.]